MAEALDPQPQEVGVGRILRDARERQGLSRQDAADGLNLSLGIIEALEADRYDLLPPRTFVKGYLRSYAKLVDVEETSVLAAFEKQQPEPAMERVRAATAGAGPVATGARLKWLALLIVVALLAYAGYEAYVTRSLEPVPAVDEAGDLAVDSGEPAPVVEALPVPSNQEPAQSSSGDLGDFEANAMDEAPSPDAEPVEIDAAPIMMPSVEAPAAGPLEAGVGSTLVIEVADESWIEITDVHGANLHVGLVQGPQTLRVTGDPPFQLVIGNADRVKLQYDGEPVALESHSRRNVARLTVPLSP